MSQEMLAIFQEARTCTKCYGRIHLHVPAPDEENGGIGARILFLVERPGRVGTGKSGKISFENDDPTARFFKELFLSTGINRKRIFITNVVLCHPLVGGYKDTPPTAKQIQNCLYFLRKQVTLIKPKLIVTLGTKPLQAVKYLFPHRKMLRKFTLKADIGKVVVDDVPCIYPLYHTSMRARLTRPAQKQRKDWAKIPRILKEVEKA